MANKGTFDFHAAMLDLASRVDAATRLMAGVSVPFATQENLKGFHDHYANFRREVDQGEPGVANSILQASGHAVQLARRLLDVPALNESLRQEFKKLAEKAEQLMFRAQTSDVFFVPLAPSSNLSSGDAEIKPEFAAHDAHRRELERQVDAIRQEIAAAELRLAELRNEGDALGKRVNDQLTQAAAAYESGTRRVEKAQEDFNELIGVATGNIIHGDYSESAKREKNAADRTRLWALACMAAVVIGLGYTLFETNLDEMKWQSAVTRGLLALAVSIPAGYLARESLRHRTQQHSYLQTALNLKAMEPFIASLPEPERNALKAEMAQRLFSTNRHPPSEDLGLLNVHELLVQAIKQLGAAKPK